MTVELLVFQLLNGLVWGMILALIALGLSLIYGLLEIVNVAHGSLYMLGAVIAWYVIGFTGSFWVALVAAPLLVGLVGMLIERLVLRRIENQVLLTIITTIGLMFVIQYSVLAVFGGELQRIRAPIEATVPVFGNLRYSAYRLFAAGLAGAIFLILWLGLRRTRFGAWVRAVKQDREMAVALGIPAQLVYLVTFGIGSGLAGLGGVLAAPIVIVEYTMGMNILVTTFIIVIIGGLGSLWGSAATGVLIGILTGLASAFLDPTQATIAMLLAMMGVVLVRPDGVFASARSKR